MPRLQPPAARAARRERQRRPRGNWWPPLLAAATLAALAAANAGGLALDWQAPVPSLSTPDRPGCRLVLEYSRTLAAGDWQEAARVRHRLFPYPDLAAAGRPAGFYRIAATALELSDDWSNQLVPADGQLFTPASGEGLAATRFAKFSILLDRPDRVCFQDTARWPWHYHFAVARLPGYAGMSVLDYNAQALYPTPGQRMVVGSVLRAPDPQVREVGIEVTGSVAFPIDRVADWITAVQRRVVLDAGWRTFYLPSAEQRAAAEAGAAFLASRGITLDSLARWAGENAGYSPGWALGRLVFIPGTEVPAALGDGRLALSDILVTDFVPADLPVLAGFLALEPAGPNSHVALLARSLALPFAYADGAGLQAEITSLCGREVLLVVEDADGECRITLTDTTGLLTPERRQEILASKQGGPLDITPKAHAGTLSLPADPLTPAEACYAGGKAANFGFLRRSLPDHSPAPAIAFTFDLWDAYLAQPLPGGQTLAQQIDARLGSFVYPPDVGRLRAELAAVRDLVTGTADFDAAQQAAIIDALQLAGLGGRNIRFRSSTNVEDADTFSGAGLYDSYSGCLEDDLDADAAGPSRCDATEPRERGVFRALRKVYASFYNENAFLERLRHGVDESTAGMAVLVHYSSPDPTEMANGVALLAVDKTGGTRRASARIVTQLGAVSVTNPDPAVRPETITASYTGTDTAGATLTLVEPSSLTPGGAPVMPWEDDYRILLDQLDTATLAWEHYYPDRAAFELDFEFKRIAPGEVGLKQVRAVPHPAPVPPPTIP